MRKRIKTKIIEILNTLGKAHQHVELLLQKGMVQEAADMLAKCQECALEAGSTIEKSDGMGTKAVSGLEEYCELLYQMSQAADWKAVKNLKRQIDGALRKIERSLEELPLEPVKVVFMPYKASMWDCLESIWEAADADKDCIAYVVPIPFVEKNAQGGVEKECYEGDMFPKEVPIIHYSQFSLEQEEPEIIYIHNPYDNGNYVTSVYPEYYSFQLKKYTDMLVYVPYYFGGNGPMPDGHQDLPVYHYADKIILQDKEKVESLADESLRAKAVAMGSPKVDRLLKLEKRRDEIIEKEICAEWREKIRGKKVILYNISVSGILQNSEYAMEKIRYVLSRFRGRDDVVLWWRPHPLIEGTLKSMRPKLYGEYMQIKNAFLREEKGILDESGDAGVAAVVADAYLGEDTSSLVHYFGVLGKAVMFTDWRVVEDVVEKTRDYIYFMTFFEENNMLYFVPSNRGLAHELYALDLGNGETKKVMTFPGISENVDACYCGIKKIQNKIVLVPHNTEDIYIYDMDKQQAVKLVLAESKGKKMLFDKAVEYEDKLFLFPKCYPAIVRIDMRTLDICEFKECVAPFFHDDEQKKIFTWAYLIKEQYVYIAAYNESKILIFNMDDATYKIKNIGNYPYGYSHMVYDGKNYWLASCKKNSVVKWNEDTEETREYNYLTEVENEESLGYNRLIIGNKSIIICYGNFVEMSAIDIETGKNRPLKEVKNVLLKMKKESTINGGGLVSVKVLKDNTVFIFNQGNCTVYIWDINTNQWRTYLSRLQRNEMLTMEKEEIERNKIIKSMPNCLYESMLSINQFIDYIGENKIKAFERLDYKKICGEDTIGNEIHKRVFGSL